MGGKTETLSLEVLSVVLLQEEDREFKIEQDRRKKEKREKMIKRNKARRMKREADQQKLEEEKLQQMLKEEDQLRIVLENLFKCPFCNFLMAPPSPIYQCGDGHILCHQCRNSAKLKVKSSHLVVTCQSHQLRSLQDCPSCDRDLAGRNVAMERIASLVFPAAGQSEERPGDGPEDGAVGGAAGAAGGDGGPSAPPTE